MYRLVLPCVVTTLFVSWIQADDDLYSKVVIARHSQILVESVREIRVSTRVGDIAVVQADGDQMTVEADVRVDRKRVDASKAGERFEDHVLVNTAEGVITIADSHGKELNGTPWKVSLKIGLPRQLSISGQTGVGNIRVDFAEGRVALKTGVGDVTIKVDRLDSVQAEAGVGSVDLQLGTVAGDVSATVGTGDAKLQGKEIMGKVEVKSGVGDVAVQFLTPNAGRESLIEAGVGKASLELPENASGQFDLVASVGSIDVIPPSAFKCKQTLAGGTASGRCGTAQRTYKVKSGVGSVKLRLHPETGQKTR